MAKPSISTSPSAGNAARSRPDAGRRMRGKWLCFGKDLDINSGPSELALGDASTSRATLDAYNRRAVADHAGSSPGNHDL